MREPKEAKNETSHNAAEQPQNDVHDDAITSTLHDLAGQPTRNQSGQNPSQKTHMHRPPLLPQEPCAGTPGKGRYSFALPHETRKPVESSKSSAFKPIGG